MSKKYFTGLNYTLGNEDTSLEISLVKNLKLNQFYYQFVVLGEGHCRYRKKV